MKRLALIAGMFVMACSAKSTSPGEQPRASGMPAPGTAQAAPAPQPAAAPPAAARATPRDPREPVLAKTVAELLEDEHLLHHKLDDDLSRTAFASYLDRLDAAKLFLLQPDRDALKQKYETKIDDELRAGSLDLAHEGEQLFVDRVAVIDKLVQSLLAQPMNHTDEEWYELDPKKVQPAKTDDELKDRWRRKLELEVLERVGSMEDRLDAEKKKATDKAADKTKGGGKAKAAGKGSGAGSGSGSSATDEDADVHGLPLAQIPTTPEAREAKARADLAKSYAARFARLGKPEPLDAASDLLNAVSTSLDPHTDYLPPADKANFDIQMSGSLEGIGAALREKDDLIEVSELIPGGAAWRQGGLSQGDLILSVASGDQDPVDVTNMHIDDVVKMIRGPKGTVVRLHVRKPDGHEDTIAITRDVIVIEESYARGAVLGRKAAAGPSYGYIHLPSFYGTGKRTSAKDVGKLLEEMKAKKVAGVILDLRSNGGGLLTDSVDIAGELIDEGPVVQVQDSRGRKEVLGDDHAGVEYDGPVIVLVDRFSASASEILAGAMQDYHRAVIVGTGPTHGKGTVQTLADLDRIAGKRGADLGVLKLTIQQFFRVSGSSTQREGVTPDIVLPDPAGYIDAGEKQLEHAIAWSKIDPAKHTDWKAAWKIDALAKASEARVAKDPVLSKVAAATQVLRARKEDTKVPLAHDAWVARRKQQKAELDAASPDLAKAPAKLTVKPIDDADAPVIAPGPGGKKDDRPLKWRDGIAKDPWIDECVAILAEMK